MLTLYPAIVKIAFLLAAAVQAEGLEPSSFSFGAFQSSIEGLGEPSDLALAPDGTVYIADAATHRVLVFSSAGSLLRRWGVRGTRNGRFLEPGGIAVDHGSVYVSDTGNHRIQVFDLRGRFRGKWGEPGNGPGQFFRPRGICAVKGTVYVADSGNDSVKVFDSSGVFRARIGTSGDRDGQLREPWDVTVDARGQVYVADTGNHRIQVFDSEGKFQRNWGDWGPFPGLFDEPVALFIEEDRIWATDRRNHRLQAFDGRGQLLSIWGMHELVPHEGKGRFHYPSAMAIANDRSFGLVCEAVEGRCQRFSRAAGGAYEETAILPSAKEGRTHFGKYPALQGNLLAIAEPENHFVYVFDIRGELPIHINSFGERGTGFGLMLRTTGLAFENGGNELLATDPATKRAQTFEFDYDPTGPLRFQPEMTRFTRAVDYNRLEGETHATGNRRPFCATVLRIAPNGERYLLDPENAQILVFDKDWKRTRAWNIAAAKGSATPQPTDFGFNREGTLVYVVDSLNARVLAFASDGRFRFSFGRPGTRDKDFQRPFGIAAGSDGYVYVTDWTAHRILKFDGHGRYKTSWGNRGSGLGELWNPAGIVGDGKGRLFVIDHGNHRGQIFTSEGEWLATFTAGRAFTKANPPPKPR